jgi:thiol:disulfide interchange protein DsbC
MEGKGNDSMKQAVRLLIVVMTMALVPLASAGEFDAIRQAVARQMQGAEPTSITKSPVAGLYEVTVPPRVFYMTKDARFVFVGDLIDLQSSKNVTEDKRTGARKAALEKVKDSMIVFAPKGETKHTVTVFTDIDCAYCRKLHSQIGEYNKLGIAIRYLAFPRAGIGSASYKKAVNVWCAKDPRKALTRAKNGETVPEHHCDSPVAQQYRLGQLLGVNGTPALVLENGEIYPGYVPPKRLAQLLDHMKKQSQAKLSQ